MKELARLENRIIITSGGTRTRLYEEEWGKVENIVETLVKENADLKAKLSVVESAAQAEMAARRKAAKTAPLSVKNVRRSNDGGCCNFSLESTHRA